MIMMTRSVLESKIATVAARDMFVDDHNQILVNYARAWCDLVVVTHGTAREFLGHAQRHVRGVATWAPDTLLGFGKEG